ncbi:hypothetical protein NE237_016162 [Protea cynaroides]|uniref:Uncharacterized protein n=1 Tax=Protea cynaroides TaxID=273540 RepID=A0A9Q0KFC6_9MAGN|nr:hypothetical protein NE237_016162 [Protea cynaroides]
MAGMLPGVELARRRKTHSQQDSNRYSRRDFFLPERIQPSSTRITSSTVCTMDATALKARIRLDEKLGNFRSRCKKHPQLPSHVLHLKQIHTSEIETRAEVCRNNPQLRRKNSEKKVCAKSCKAC